MDAIIAYRVNSGPVEIVITEAEDVAVFGTREQAELYVRDNRLFQSGQAAYQILELDELDGSKFI